jgi:hypothetical protein
LAATAGNSCPAGSTPSFPRSGAPDAAEKTAAASAVAPDDSAAGLVTADAGTGGDVVGARMGTANADAGTNGETWMKGLMSPTACSASTSAPFESASSGVFSPGVAAGASPSAASLTVTLSACAAGSDAIAPAFFGLGAGSCGVGALPDPSAGSSCPYASERFACASPWGRGAGDCGGVEAARSC